MSELTNEDLLNELNSMPTEKKSKKKKKKAAAEPEEEKKKEEVPIQSNEDLLNELESMPTEKKSKKKKKKGGNEQEEESKKEELNKEEPKKEEEKKEEEKKEEENEDEKEDEKEEEKEEEKKEKKKKKIIKKVVKKGGKKKQDNLLIKMLQEKQQQARERAEQLAKEEAERIKREEEEELKRQKEEEERRKIEEAAKEEEMKRLKHLSELGIKANQIAKLDANKKKTEEMLKQQGTTLEEVLNSLNDIKVPYKKKKKVKVEEEKKKENEEKIEDKIEEKNEKEDEEKEEKNLNDEENEEEDDEPKYHIQDNQDVDDWEDEVGDEETNDKENEKKEEKKEKNEIKEEKIEKKEKNKPQTSKDDKKFMNIPLSTELNENLTIDKKTNKKLRAPIICVLGHVDAGKTKILDKLRHSNVQIGEAGGITQQIGATFVPIENFEQHLKKIDKKFQIKPQIPGILLIDTPGHASFQNLRSRGSSLCDIAVVIVNIVKGLEQQTLESLEILKQRKTPFIVALNQLDRIYQWNSTEWGGFRESYDKQKKSQKKEFTRLVDENKTQFIKNNLNTELYDKNEEMNTYVNLVPTSAITGEGLPDVLGLLVYLTQKYLLKKIEYRDEIQCTILEVKVLEGIGTTIDVILVNGTIKVGDKIVVGGLFGPIKTTVKIILLPHPMKEMRVKCEYERHDQISGAIGVKLFCPDLENALAGSPLYVYKNDEEAEKYGKEITRDFNSIVQDDLAKNGKGIMVQASTLGSLEAILTYLKDQKIQVSVVGVGNLNKKDVIKMQTVHSQTENPLKEDLVILCFDNKVLPEAQQYADQCGIKILNDEVIYHLFDSYIAFKKQCEEERKKEKEKEAIFPCVLKTVMFINKKDPLIIGVDVVEGILKVGTPIYCVEKKLNIGTVESIEKEHKSINNVKPQDGSVSIRVKVVDNSLAAGRHFDEKSTFISKITRNSIDALKQYFRDDMTTDDWKIVIKLKKILEIQ